MTNFDLESKEIPMLDQNTMRIGNRIVKFEYAVQEAFPFGELIIVWLDPESYQQKFGQFPNIIAFSASGVELWKAELPTNQSGDRFDFIFSKQPLIAGSFTSFRCTIDPETGKIVEKEFLK